MFLDHNPPHVHAKYGNRKGFIEIEIESGIVKGEMSERALHLIFLMEGFA